MAKKSSPAEITSAGKKNASKGKLHEVQHSFVHVFPEWCKGCGICVEFCPVGVLEMKNQKAIVAHPEKCVRCYLCARRCPDFAIGIEDSNGRVNDTQDKQQRLPEMKVKGEGDSR